VNVSVVRKDAHFFTTALISNPLEHLNVHLFNAVENRAADLSGLSVVRNECHCRKCGGFDAGFAESAVDGRVIFASVFFQVEVNHLCTVSNIVTDVIESVRLNTGGERSHLSLFTLVPDDTLNESLAAAHGKEVNGGGGRFGVAWGCVPVDALSIGHLERLPRGSVPPFQLSHHNRSVCLVE